MADKRCSISLVVNGQRWLEEGDTLAEVAGMPRPWSLCGLQDFVRITVGAKLGFTFENTDFVEQRWCRAKANAGDAEAIVAGFTVVTTPHITSSDAGAGLSLEAVDVAAANATQVIVTVGNQMNWMPLRQKLEARKAELFELLLPPAGKVVVSTERVIDIRELARQHFGDDKAKALFRAPPQPASTSTVAANAATAAPEESFAANAAQGTVKSLANGYGIIKRKDGLGDVQFMATHVRPPGFDFIEIGDELRFDVVQVSPGKWLAQRVVRM